LYIEFKAQNETPKNSVLNIQPQINEKKPFTVFTMESEERNYFLQQDAMMNEDLFLEF
jgi:hypothetical protein